jgi:hypothetical protein
MFQEFSKVPKSVKKIKTQFSSFVFCQCYRIKTRLVSSLAIELDQTILKQNDKIFGMAFGFRSPEGDLKQNTNACSFCCARIRTRAVILEF